MPVAKKIKLLRSILFCTIYKSVKLDDPDDSLYFMYLIMPMLLKWRLMPKNVRSRSDRTSLRYKYTFPSNLQFGSTKEEVLST